MKKIIALILAVCFTHTWVIAQDNYMEISLPALMKKYQQHPANMVIVDVRTPGEYHDTASRYKQGDIGHIKGAININVQDLDKDPGAVKQLEGYKDKEIYLICSHSFRSRHASNILLKNGFAHVNNVQGGMTEWFRRYDELTPYKALYETAIPYKNIASGQLLDALAENRDMLLIGINLAPATWYDSATQQFLGYAPGFKNAVYYNNTDSAKILELARQQPGKQVVLFNNYSYGAAEMADWLAKQGVRNCTFMVGGINYFCEYVADKNLFKKAAPVLTPHSGIRFISPIYYCNELAGKKGTVLVDLRHDTLFNKVNDGIKNDFTHVKGSVNFYFKNGAAAFEQQFPDHKASYTLLSRNGTEGLDLADELTKKGYTVNWVLGGIQRWDWYSINMNTFHCSDYLLK